MQNFEIRFIGLPFWSIALIAAVGFVLLVSYFRFLRAVGFTPAAVPIALRAAAIAAILVLAANPLFIFDSKKPIPRRIAILVDTSQSMGIKDRGNNETRFEIASRAALNLHRALKAHRTWPFVFDETRRPGSWKLLAGERTAGKSTYMISSIKGIETGEGLPLTDTIVISDGRDNSGMAFSPETGQPRIHTVAIGPSGPDVNISLGDAVSPDIAFVKQPVTVSGEVKAAGIPEGESYIVEISKDRRRLASAKFVSAGKALSGNRFSLTFTPAETGMHILTLRARSAVQENTDVDNQKYVFIDVVSGKRRILLVDVPRWEFAFLKRHLAGQDKAEAHTLLLTDRGSSGDEKRQVLSSAAALGENRLVITGAIGDTATPAEKRALRDYLIRGGALVLLGGGDSLISGGDSVFGGAFRTTKPSGVPQGQAPFSPRLTEEGRRSPLMRLAPDPAANAELWASLPYMYSFNPILPPPGARVYAEHPWASCGSGKCPLAMYTRVGRGRLFLVPMEGLWRWKLVRRETDYFDTFWSNVISMLLEPEETRPLIVTLESRHFMMGGRACFEAKIEPGLTTASPPSALVKNLDSGTSELIEMKRFQDSKDFYRSCFETKKPGVYALTVKAGGITSIPEPFAVEVSGEEFLLTSANTKLLGDISKRTGGTAVSAKQVEKLIKELNKPGQWRMVRTEADLWRAPWCWFALGFLIVVLSAEWIIRRRGGLT